MKKLDGSEYSVFVRNGNGGFSKIRTINQESTLSPEERREDEKIKFTTTCPITRSLFWFGSKRKRFNKKGRIEFFAKRHGISFRLARKMIIKSTQKSTKISISIFPKWKEKCFLLVFGVKNHLPINSQKQNQTK